MKQGTFLVKTGKTMELIDITDIVEQELRSAGIEQGACFLFNPHTTAGLTINEGADPAVRHDIISGLKSMVPMNYPFTHQEGNSPAHIMATLTGCSLNVLVQDGKIRLGTWQRIFFCEYDGPRTRKVHWHVINSH